VMTFHPVHLQHKNSAVHKGSAQVVQSKNLALSAMETLVENCAASPIIIPDEWMLINHAQKLKL